MSEGNENGKNPTGSNDLAGDDNKGNAGDGTGGAPQNNGQAAPADRQDQPSGAEIYRPEGMPEHFLGKDDRETIDKLYKTAEGYRKEQAKNKGLPEKFEDYKIELPKEIAEKVLKTGEDGTDPIFEAARKKAFERGIPADVMTEMLVDFYSEVAKTIGDPAGDDGEGEQIDLEFKSFGGAEKAKPVQDAVNAWITGLKTQGVIDDQDVKELQVMSAYGEGLRALDKIRVKTGGKPIPAKLEGGARAGGVTQDQLDVWMRDPKYWREKDPAWIKKVDDGFREMYGEEAA